MALTITSSNYDELMAGDIPVVIDFWAEWCGPCRMMTPIVEKLAEEFEGKAAIGKCNVDEEDDVVSNYMIRSIPTIVIVKGGQVVDKQVGACSEKELREKIEKYL